MANVYYKIMNKSISRDYTDKIINAIQKELVSSVDLVHENMFDATNTISKRTPLMRNNSIDINKVLKYYLINQVLKESGNAVNINKNYIKTPNNNILKDPINNKYYRITDDGVKPVENIEIINKDGSYIINENRLNSSFTIKKLYDNTDELISIQLVKSNGTVIGDRIQAAEILGMRKEYAYRYKYSGYSGNSNDIIASILNYIHSPVETGYYMDFHYNTYSWNEYSKCFCRKLNDDTLTPLLVDYEFESYRKVIRKEYTGVN